MDRDWEREREREKEIKYLQVDTEYCSRCRMKEAEIVCSACTPFMFFCIPCDGYVHTMNSKRNHTRRQVVKRKENAKVYLAGNSNNINKEYENNWSSINSGSNYGLNNFSSYSESSENNNLPSKMGQTGFSNYTNFKKDQPLNLEKDKERERERDPQINSKININYNLPNNSNTNASTLFSKTSNFNKSNSISNFKNNLSIDYTHSSPTFNNLNKGTEAITTPIPTSINRLNSPTRTASQGEDYINEIKKMYDNERETLVNTVMVLQKQIDISKTESNEKIINLQNKLEESNKNHAVNVRLMKDEHDAEIRKLFGVKENEAKFLSNKNLEIEKSNEELLSRVNEYYNEITFLKRNHNDRFTAMDYEVKTREHELNEMTLYYEKKIIYISDNFGEEKAKIINNYENNIDKINTGYRDSKEKFLALISEQEAEYKDLYKKSRLEEDKLHTTIDMLKFDLGKLKTENSNLIEANNQLKMEIKTFKEELERGRKETDFYLKESKQFEKDLIETTKENEETKLKYEKLHILTHGKFKKK